MGDHKMADAELLVDVNTFILEYLLYNATKALLDARDDYGPYEARQAAMACENHLLMVNNWLAIFTSLCSNSRTPASLRFRLLLLKFTTLFTQRYHHTATTPSSVDLTLLRQTSKARARSWREHAPNNAFDDVALAAFVARVVTDRRKGSCDSRVAQDVDMRDDDGSDEAEHEVEDELPTLLDLLPLFIELTAARASLGDLVSGEEVEAVAGFSVSVMWMELVAAMMRQACVEQYKVHGATTAAPVLEAFAWGLVDREEDEGRGVGGRVEIDEDMIMDDDNIIVGKPHISGKSDTEMRRKNRNTAGTDGSRGSAMIHPNSALDAIFCPPTRRYSSISTSSSSSRRSSISSPIKTSHSSWSTIRTKALITLLSLPPRTFLHTPPPSSRGHWVTRYDIDTGQETSEYVAVSGDEAGDETEDERGTEEEAEAIDVEASIPLFLRGLLDSHPKPLLVALEDMGDDTEGLEDGEESDDGFEPLSKKARIGEAEREQEDVAIEGVGRLRREEVRALRTVCGMRF